MADDGGKWLNMHYGSHVFDFWVVSDYERYSLLDLVMEIDVEGLKQNVLPPSNPRMKYYPPGGKVLREMLTDADLHRMFGLYEKSEEVHVYLEDSPTPSHVVLMAKNLRKQQEKMEKELYEQEDLLRQMEREREFEEEERQRKQREEEENERKQREFKEDVRRSFETAEDDPHGFWSFFENEFRDEDLINVEPINKEIPVINLDETHNEQPTHGTPRKGFKVKHVASKNKLTPIKKRQPTEPHSTSTPFQPTPEPSIQPFQSQPTPTYSQPIHSHPTHSQPLPTYPNQSKPTPNNSHHSQAAGTHLKGRKIPRSTAKKKGVFQPQTRTAVETEHSPTQSKGRATRTAATKAYQSMREEAAFDPDDSSEGDDSDASEPICLDSDEDEAGSDVSLVDEEPFVDEPPEYDFDEAEKNKRVIDLDEEPDDVSDAVYLDRIFRNGHIYHDPGFGQIRLEPWMIFLDKEHFHAVLRDYCVQQGIDLVVKRSENKRYTAECGWMTCPWRIHASRLPDKVSWAIKTMENVHKCDRIERNPMANVDWLCEKLLEDIRGFPEIPAKVLCELAFSRWMVKVPTPTMYKVRAKAQKYIHGAHDKSYGDLPGYVEMAKLTNPGSCAFITWRSKGPEMPLQFKRIFLSFEAQFKGFIQGCRPVIGVDGCHLKGNYNGMLLSAVALDGNQELFPLAYAVCADETTDSWMYFFSLLKIALRGSGREDWTFMSDRMKNKFSSPFLEAYFWTAADAYNVFVFNKAMANIKKHSREAFHYLNDIDKKLWARHTFDPSICSPDNTNNFTESFNSTLGLDRVRPVLGLLEGIRRSCMIRIAKRQSDVDSWEDDITPYATKQVKLRNEESRFCKIFPSNNQLYEVRENTTTFPVDLQKGTCFCGYWQISGIPCRHAIRVIHHMRYNPNKYVSSYYSVQMYKDVYGSSISPITEPKQWPELDVPVIMPPDIKRTSGRPPRNRKRQQGEKKKGKRSVTVQCQKCFHYGHNKSSCMGGPTAAERKRKAVELKGEGGPKTSRYKGRQTKPKKHKKSVASQGETSAPAGSQAEGGDGATTQ